MIKLGTLLIKKKIQMQVNYYSAIRLQHRYKIYDKVISLTRVNNWKVFKKFISYYREIRASKVTGHF